MKKEKKATKAEYKKPVLTKHKKLRDICAADGTLGPGFFVHSFKNS